MNDVALGLAQGLEKAANNLITISMARQKLNQEKEIFGLDKKVKELEIKKAEFLLDPEQIKLEREKLKADAAYKTAAYNVSLLTLDSKAREEKRKAEEHQKGWDIYSNLTKNGTVPLPTGHSIKIGDVSLGSSNPPAGGFLAGLLNGDQDTTEKAPTAEDFLAAFK